MRYNPNPQPDAIWVCLYLIIAGVMMTYVAHTIYDDVQVYLNRRRYFKYLQTVCTCTKKIELVLLSDKLYWDGFVRTRCKRLGYREKLFGSICPYCESRGLNDPPHRDDDDDYYNYHEGDYFDEIKE